MRRASSAPLAVRLGIISGLAVFARRRLRLIVIVTQNNDAHRSWHTITIANRSDLSLSFRGFVLSWFITTPLGRIELNRAYTPEDDPDLVAIAAPRCLLVQH